MNNLEKVQILEAYVKGNEDFLINKFIQDGPSQIKLELNLKDSEWLVIFDCLVFEHNLLYKTVLKNTEFFVDAYVKYGMDHARSILDVSDNKYDLVWEVVFDYIVGACDALYLHVLEKRDYCFEILENKGGQALRNSLGISKGKYDVLWEKVLTVLLNVYCENATSEQNFSSGLKAFSLLMNESRVQRPINEFGLLI